MELVYRKHCDRVIESWLSTPHTLPAYRHSTQQREERVLFGPTLKAPSPYLLLPYRNTPTRPRL